MFLRTKQLQNSPLGLILVSLAHALAPYSLAASLAQYSASSSSHRNCCWGDHGTLLASCNLPPDAPSASVSAGSRLIRPCLILLISIFEGTCLSVLVLPASLSYPGWTSLSRGSLPTVEQGTPFTSSLNCLVLWELLAGFVLCGSSTTSTVSKHLSSPSSSVSSPSLKNGKNKNKICVVPLPNNPDPKPHPSSLTKNRNERLSCLF